jgi:hypothetical protein
MMLERTWVSIVQAALHREPKLIVRYILARNGNDEDYRVATMGICQVLFGSHLMLHLCRAKET